MNWSQGLPDHITHDLSTNFFFFFACVLAMVQYCAMGWLTTSLSYFFFWKMRCFKKRTLGASQVPTLFNFILFSIRASRVQPLIIQVLKALGLLDLPPFRHWLLSHFSETFPFVGTFRNIFSQAERPQEICPQLGINLGSLWLWAFLWGQARMSWGNFRKFCKQNYSISENREVFGASSPFFLPKGAKRNWQTAGKIRISSPHFQPSLSLYVIVPS